MRLDLNAARQDALVRRVIAEIWNGGDLDLADALFAPTYRNQGGLIPDLVQGPEAIKVSVAFARAAFPAFQVGVVDLVSQGPTVALHWTAHRDPMQDGAAARHGMTFARLCDGLIVESWTCWERRPDDDMGRAFGGLGRQGTSGDGGADAPGAGRSVKRGSPRGGQGSGRREGKGEPPPS